MMQGFLGLKMSLPPLFVATRLIRYARGVDADNACCTYICVLSLVMGSEVFSKLND